MSLKNRGRKNAGAVWWRPRTKILDFSIHSSTLHKCKTLCILYWDFVILNHGSDRSILQKCKTLCTLYVLHRRCYALMKWRARTIDLPSLEAVRLARFTEGGRAPHGARDDWSGPRERVAKVTWSRQNLKILEKTWLWSPSRAIGRRRSFQNSVILE